MSSISSYTQTIAIDESMKRHYIEQEQRKRMRRQEAADEREADRAQSNVESAKLHKQNANQQPTPITNTEQPSTPTMTTPRQSPEDGIGANFNETV